MLYRFLSPSPPSPFCSSFTLAGVRRRAVNMDGGAESIAHETVLFSSFGCALHY